MRSTFGLIGVGGYIAPRHLQAIKLNNGALLCALDKHDSVGVLDSYFPEAHFFTELERFERHINKLNTSGKALNYLSICSPNFLHDSHIRLALNSGANAICEKPLCLSPWNLDALELAQHQSKKHIFAILQLRLHPSILALKKQVQSALKANKHKVFNIDLSYITARGKWYMRSWKGDSSKSGGIASNIGVHFFDMLMWIFGEVRQSIVHRRESSYASGMLSLKHANVRWFLSIEKSHLPTAALKNNQSVYRALQLDGKEFDFSSGFEDLHTLSYKHILNNKGFGTKDARAAIELIYRISQATPLGLKGDYHPLNKDKAI